jgi:hypothetical protein
LNINFAGKIVVPRPLREGSTTIITIYASARSQVASEEIKLVKSLSTRKRKASWYYAMHSIELV